MSREAGKGSGRRRSAVSDEVVSSNWALAFGKKNTNVDNEIERLSVPAFEREYFNIWTKVPGQQPSAPAEEVYSPHLTINS